MYIHAENLDDSSDSSLDLSARAFLRLGRNEMNYYGYEIPVKYTTKGRISVDEIWPQENLIEVAIQDFIKVLSQRDSLSNYRFINRFSYVSDSKHKDKIIVDLLWVL